MITIPITDIFVTLVFLISNLALGSVFGIYFTAIFDFGADNSVIIRNMIIGVVICFCVSILTKLTLLGIIVWS